MKQNKVKDSISVGGEIFFSTLSKKIETAKKKFKKNNLIHGRISFASKCIVVLFLIIASRIAFMSFSFNFNDWFQTKEKTQITQAQIRSDITDRYGELLATNIPTEHLYANATEILYPEETAKKLVKLFPALSYSTIVKKLKSNKRFTYIQKRLKPSEKEQILLIGDPGLMFENSSQRVYPKGNLFAHLIGFTNIDNKGLGGTELAFDMDLDRMNEPLQLSVDARIQSIMYDKLKKGIQEYSALGGGAILMNPNTGEIIAMMSMPDFDPKNASSASTDQRFNKMISGVYELGSIFKVFNTALAFENGIPVTKKYNVHEPLRIGRFRIRDDHPLENEMATVEEILVHSSNIGSGQIAWEIGADKQKDFLKKLGLLDALKIDLKEGDIAKPLYPDRWAKAEIATISFGHGIAVSPLQLLTSINAMINGGFYIPPRITPLKDNQPNGHRVISSDVSEKVREAMTKVVEEGTGSKVKTEGITIGGKTGTGEKNINGKYERNRLITAFVSTFPMERPEYTLLVVLDEPKGRKQDFYFKGAAWNAVPISRDIIQGILPLLELE